MATLEPNVLWQRLQTYSKLGLGAAASVLVYRLACRTGIYKLIQPVARADIAGPLFRAPHPLDPDVAGSTKTRVLDEAQNLLAGRMRFFSSALHDVGSPPAWLHDPVADRTMAAQSHWSDVDEFSQGDIKNVWEMSRMQWAPRLAAAYCLSRECAYLDTLNSWLADWTATNAANQGPNWKCGQETGLRLLQLALTAQLTGDLENPDDTLLTLVEAHLRRIPATYLYAKAQNNNHGTSEATALFVGGLWLAAHGQSDASRQFGRRIAQTGQERMVERVMALVEPDGSFSQYSTNYHRVLLDTLSLGEFFRRRLGGPIFEDVYLERVRAAISWLATMTDGHSGDAPNFGANDGALIVDLGAGEYRDFRPSVQLASALFGMPTVLADGPWNDSLHWLSIAPPRSSKDSSRRPQYFPDGGFAALPIADGTVFIRFANFRFRPSHADCLHLDLWHKGVNLLCDAGTYSYNTEAHWMAYFSGTESHNTVQFDNVSQMPRIGRFLFADWLTMDSTTRVSRTTSSWSGSYTSHLGHHHRRDVTIDGRVITVTDLIRGHSDNATLRWRLGSGDWRLSDGRCESALATITVTAANGEPDTRLTTGWESRHYCTKHEIPVLETTIGRAENTLTTRIELPS